MQRRAKGPSSSREVASRFRVARGASQQNTRAVRRGRKRRWQRSLMGRRRPLRPRLLLLRRVSGRVHATIVEVVHLGDKSSAVHL